MWNIFSRAIIKFRIPLLVLLIALTAFMLHQAKGVRLSYSVVKILPEDNQVYIDYTDFNKKYGRKNIMAISVADTALFSLEHLSDWHHLSEKIDKIKGVEQLVSITNLPLLKKDKLQKKFITEQWYDSTITSQSALDSAIILFNQQQFYKGLLYNEKNHSTLMLVTLVDSIIQTPKRLALIKEIKTIVNAYAKQYNLSIYFSGLPYIRTIDSIKVRDEISIFIFLTLLITSLILYLFFRSFKATFVSMLVVVIGVIFSFGTMALFDYEISILLALVPPLIIVIGIPNCIFLINKFHNEFKEHKNKIKALKRMICKIGNITLLTNLTTASGFAAFVLTKSQTLKEFGVISSLNILFIFLISLLVIPIMFSFFPPPKKRHTQHLDKKWVRGIVGVLIKLVKQKRPAIYVITVSLTLIGIYGLLQVKTTGNLTDDLPKKGVLYQDLKFFEHSFGGVMPLEIIVDTKKKNGLMKSYNLRKMEQLQDLLATYPEFSRSNSYIDIVKYAKQSFYNGDSSFYNLPNNQESRILLSYLKKSDIDVIPGIVLMDSLRREARISLRMADISTLKMDSILGDLHPKINTIFNPDKYDVTITGASIVFLNGTKFLIRNLIISLLLVIVLIAIFMAWMFNSFRMVIVSLIPNLIPLLLTAAIMGYFGIALKPSTILVFSIAFGISVDDTIHFLAKYRQELIASSWNIRKSVFAALKETGVSMIYTSTVLFCGFFIFVASDFGGTIALGLLVSITLLIAMLANLLLLPALLLSLERIITGESFSEALLDTFNEEEDVELDALEIKQKEK